MNTPQEGQALRSVARDLAASLRQLNESTAIDLDTWPEAKALVEWDERVPVDALDPADEQVWDVTAETLYFTADHAGHGCAQDDTSVTPAEPQDRGPGVAPLIPGRGDQAGSTDHFSLPATCSGHAPEPNVPTLPPAGEALVQQIAEVMSGISVWVGFRDEAGDDDMAEGTIDSQDLRTLARAVLPLVEAQVAPLRARLDAVEALHWPHESDVFVSDTRWCDVDSEDWPCPTIRTLRGEKDIDPHPDIVGALADRAESAERFSDLMHDLRWLRKRMDDPNARMDFIAHDTDQILNKDGRS